MTEYEVRVRYVFKDTYMVAARSREEAKRVVGEDCDLVLGDNIHTTRGDDKVTDWNFGIHPGLQTLSIKEADRKIRAEYIAVNLSNRIEELRNGIIEAIRQLFQAHSPVELASTNRKDDPV